LQLNTGNPEVKPFFHHDFIHVMRILAGPAAAASGKNTGWNAIFLSTPGNESRMMDDFDPWALN